MSYTKQNFEPGQVLTAAKLNLMDDQIALNEFFVFNGALNTTTSPTPTYTSAVTKAQVEAAWPNCYLKFTIDGSSTYYYAWPALNTNSGYHFDSHAGGSTRRIACGGSGGSTTWSVNMKNESVPGYIGTVVVLGDDMCYGTGTSGAGNWTEQLTKTYDNKYTGMNTVYNAANNGACFGDYSLTSGATSINAQATAQAEHIKTADMVIICSCYNDVKAAEASNNTTYSTVLSAVRTAITTIKTYINGTGGNPKCRIVYLSYGSGYVADGNSNNYAWANNLAPTDAAIKCVCQEQGVQVIDFMAGSGCNGSDFVGSFPTPTPTTQQNPNSGAAKIGRAMVQKLIDRDSTIKPPESLVIDFGSNVSASTINPYNYNFNFLQWLYVRQGIDISIHVYNTGYEDLWLPGRLVYMSKNTTSSTPADRLAIWLIEWPSATTTSVTTTTTMNQALVQLYVSNGSTTTTYNRIAHT